MIHFIHTDRVKRVTKKRKVIIHDPILVNMCLKSSIWRVTLTPI